MENDSKQYYVKLPLWKKCTFGMIDSANNFSWSYISSFLAIYLTDTFLIPAATVSLMFLLCRFWDAINDPIVGYLADRTRSRWGRYRPWIMFASAPLFITTALLFWPHPEWAVGVKTAYVVILYALVVLFYTRCEPGLSAKYPNMGYFILAVIFAVFCIPMQILCAKSQKEVVPPQPSPKKIGIFKSLAISFKNREFMIVCILFLAQGFALYGAGTINIYWFKYVLGDVNPMATFSLITLIPSMLGCFTSQFWCNKLKHKGKAIAITYAVQVVMYVAQYFLFRNTINVTLLYVLGIVLQYFAGANISIIYGMVPDTVEVTEYQTKGIRMDGFLNTVSSFWNKVGITIGTSGAPLILALTGYVANAPTQTPAVIEGLQLMKWIMPAAFNLICLICLFWYKLGYKEFDELVAKIAAERPQWEQTTAEK